MKKYYFLLLILFVFFQQGFSSAPSSAGCSVAGTPSLSADSVCYGDTVNLLLTGYNGAIQWQSFDGTNWINETGTGSTTDNYPVTKLEPTQFRAVVTATACPPDTSINITLTVGVITMPYATDVSRCGPGNVIINGVGSNNLQWFDAPAGGNLLGSGPTLTAYVPATGTIYLENSTFGAGTGGSSPIVVNEADLDDEGSDGDNLEIMNVAPYDVDVTGWTVAVGDDYTVIPTVNAIINTLSGTLTPGQTITWSDAGGIDYWGSNFLWTGGGAGTGGWVAIIDNTGAMRDLAIWGYDEPAIQSAVVVINGTSYNFIDYWTGPPIDNNASFGNGISRISNIDTDEMTDFTGLNALTLGAVNTNETIPFLGLGCSSPRHPVQVTITAADSVDGNTTASIICRNDVITLTAASNNANYVYTWSPDSSLSSTTGSSVTATPQSSVSYVVVGDDGTCSNRDTVEISVIQHQAGVTSVTVDTVCSGNPTVLSLTDYIGSIQWQSNDGSGWVNETNPGSTSDIYTVNPLVNTDYRAIVSVATCPSDTSGMQTVAALIPTDPILSDTTVCAPGITNINAISNGNVAWYSDSTGASIYIGNPFVGNISGNPTMYAATVAGSVYNVGPVSNAIGSVTQLPASTWGLQFDVERPCIIEKVYVYPAQTGVLTIDLRDAQGGNILATKSISVTSSTTKVPVNLEWGVNPGFGYRMELSLGSVSLRYNFTGASYPYTSSGGPVTIQGFCNPAFNTGVQYMFFYDWSVIEGCLSNRVPINISTIPAPATPTITQTDSILTSSAASGNQWYLNNTLIPGATGTTYQMTQTGTYQVVVTSGNGCTSSATINVVILGVDELNSAGISVYPNPVSDRLNIQFLDDIKTEISVRLIQATGAVVYESKKERSSQISVNTSGLSQGTYLLEIYAKDAVYRKVILKD